MPVAAIDLGTNTFHLLIRDGSKVLAEERRPVRLGLGGINHGQITPEAEARALACLTDYSRLARLNGVESILAIGTSALRNAYNGREVAGRLTALTGIPIRIISGDEEAALIWEGIRSGMDLGRETNLIVDIGGGSVEFIFADQRQVFWKKSLEAGGQRLLDRFQPDDPISGEQIEEISEYLKGVLAPLSDPMRSFDPITLVGSSGSFDTFSEMYCHRIGQSYSPGPETPLTLDGLQAIMDDVIRLNRAERMEMPGMIELRVDMIVVACVVIRQILAMHPFRELRVSGYSLKEGMMATLF